LKDFISEGLWGKTIWVQHISLRVRVPVLSEQITVVHPKVSTSAKNASVAGNLLGDAASQQM